MSSSSRHNAILKIRAVQLWVAVFSSAYFLMLLGTCFAANHLAKASGKAYQMTQAMLFGRFGMVFTDAQLGFWVVTSLAIGIIYLINRFDPLASRFVVYEGGKKKRPQSARPTVLTLRREK